MLRNIISEREKNLPSTVMGKLLKIAEEDKSIISLGPGEPDFDSPGKIITAAKKYLDMGYTHYSPLGGRAELKEEIIKKLKMDNKIDAKPDNVVVTCGCTEAIFLGLLCTIDPGEGALIPDPGFLVYRPAVEVLNGMPLCVPLHEEDGFQYDVDKMKKAIIPEKTRVLFLNTPSNPTGAVFSKGVLEEIADFVVEYGLMVFCDETYEKLVYGNARHVSIGSFNGMEEYVVTMHTFSKTYAMPGFRVGYAVGPEEMIGAMTKLHIFTSVCAPTVSQMVGMHALKVGDRDIDKMRGEYDRRRRMIVKRVNEIPGFECIEPRGAFYAFPNIKSFGMNSLKFAEYLLEKARVAVVPGTEFGRMGEGFVRLSYATSYELIEKAMGKIEKAVKDLK